MSDRYLTDLAQVLRSAGLDVVELDGWQSRARGSGGYDDGRPTHVLVHHTASPPSSSGRPDAEYCAWGDDDAPLSNLCLDRDGVWWVLAAGATNTNGKGGPLDGVPADSMNTHAIGVEANGGYGEAWPKIQTDSYTQGVAALMAHYRISHCRAHFEWAPTRKIDPAGPSPWAQGGDSWNMDAFRAEVAGEGDDMPLSDDDVARIAAAVWAHDLEYPAGNVHNASWWLSRAQGIVRRYLGPWQGEDAPAETMLQRIDEQTR
jgi:N-acetylmuramoyl-L-alanine amidase